jgi:hypothetical protein
MRLRVLPAFLACAPLVLGACSGPILYQAPPCSGETGDPSAATARRLHVRVLLTHEGREQRHELVVDSEPGRIVAIGLTPMGTVAYRVTHDADGVRVENGVGRYMGLDPGLAYDAVVRGLLVEASGSRNVGAGDALSIARDDCHYLARLVVVSDRPTPAPGAAAAP